MTTTSSTAFSVVIPARYQSTRLPAKALAEIAGKPMLLHVVERARNSRAQHVYVATDDERIYSVCREAGVDCLMTSPEHQSGTDRIAEVALQLELADDSIIVNVQGDEPLIPAAVINQVADNLAARDHAGICTLYAPVQDEQEYLNPNAVKLVADDEGKVLYFSRAPIPHARDARDTAWTHARRHIGLYAYRVKVLKQFTTWPPGELEQIEKLEQLRAMAHGISIHAAACCEPIPAGVDTPEDLEAVRRLLQDQNSA